LSAYRRPPGHPKQIWFVIVMALALTAMVALIVLDLVPSFGKQAGAQPTDAHVSPGTQTTVLTGTAGPTATASAQPTGTPEPSSTQTPTGTPTPTETPTPTATLMSDHYWLEPPFSPQVNTWLSHYYPYASRADGTYPIHHGVDTGNPTGTQILASAPGTIIVAGDDLKQVYGARTNFYGKLVIQQLDVTFGDQPLYVLYGHLSEVLAEVGQHVNTGDVLGLVGATGVAMGPHLHLEVRYAENNYASTVNPELWVRPQDGYGTLAGLLLSPEGEPVPEAKITLHRAATPGQVFRTIMSYPNKEVNSDPLWGENFCTGDLMAGDWLVKVYKNQRLYTESITIEAGATSRVVIRLTQ